MNPQSRQYFWMLIVAFILVFVWGSVLPMFFGVVSFSTQSLDYGFESSGASALSAGGIEFFFIIVFGIILTIIFFKLLLNLTKQSSPYTNNEETI
ncbi:MAG: hypothetical protein ACTSUV_00200 [Candidatus Ranarchaeia archaeon]